MALQKTMTDQYGRENTDAYFVVRSIELYKKDKVARINLNTYINKAASDANKSPVAIKVYEIIGADFDQYMDIAVLDTEGVNALKQAYVYLKTTDYFADAIDV